MAQGSAVALPAAAQGRAAAGRLNPARELSESCAGARMGAPIMSAELHQLIQRAQTAMLQAEFAAGHERETLYLEAKDSLLRTETLSPGRGAWLMACLNVRMGSPALAQKWLERAHSAGALPARADIVGSAYMTGLRGHAWFEEFVARLE